MARASSRSALRRWRDVGKARAFLPFVLGCTHALIPLFPAFISLSGVAYPGISLLPRTAVYGVLGLSCALFLSFTSALFAYGFGEQPLVLPLASLAGAAAISALLGFDPSAGLLFIGIYLMAISWHCAVVRFFGDAKVARAILWAYCVSGASAAVAAVAMVLTHRPAALYAIGHGRAIGTFVLPGELAAYLVVFLPIAFAVARVGPGKLLRAVAWISVAVAAIALYETHSRAGWMGFAAAAAFLVAANVRGRRYGLLAATGVAAAGLIAVLLAFNVRHNPSEDYTRIAIWQAAEQIVDRFPLTGVGPFDFARIYPQVHVPDADATAFHAHSIYLSIFAEMGIVGLCAFAWVIWTFARRLRDRMTRASPRSAYLALAVSAGLVGVAVQGLIDTMSVVLFGLWLPTMGLALAAAAGDWERE